ncbi:sigma-E factor negative regulatory protein [Chitinibacteraceae bacterium HSL-7]
MNEQITALIDGELDTLARKRAIETVLADDEAACQWHDCHLARDVMQGHPVLSPDFMQRFSERLASEPVLLPPRVPLMKRVLVPLSVAASVAFVSVAGWQLYYGGQAQSSAGMIAAAPAEVQRVKLDDYVAAHRLDESDPFMHRHLMQASLNQH